MSIRTTSRRRALATVAAAACIAAVALVPTGANAAIVATVPLATAAEYAVLAGSAVTNTNASVLDGSIGLAGPSSTGSVTGFPPGIVLAPSTIHINDGPAVQAKADLAVAYDNAAGRPLNATTAADLTGLTLQGGVYATSDKGALLLSGSLTLDGAGNADSVFIFQTASTLTTGSASRVNLINGAQPCNVFWQVGSSATLGTNSVFVGNILALTSITVNNGVTVQGRALARNAAVTLDKDVFEPEACAAQQPGPTTTTTAPTTTTTAPTTTTTAPTTTTTTAPLEAPVAPTPSAPTSGPVAGNGGGTAVPAGTSGPGAVSGGTPASTGPGAPGAGTGGSTPTGRVTTSAASPGTPTDLARTGSALDLTFLVGLCLVALGAGAVRLGRTEE